MLRLIKESKLNCLYNKIDELKRQLQGANDHSKTLEEYYLKKLKEKTDEITLCNNKLNDSQKEIKDLENDLGAEKSDNKSQRESLENYEKRLDEVNKKLDSLKRYQKEFSTQKTKELCELKEQLESKQKELDAANDDMQKKKAEIAMMSALYEAGVTELCKFMRTTPAFKTKKKEVVMELADEMICKRAKETLGAHVQKKENQTEYNKEESKDNE